MALPMLKEFGCGISIRTGSLIIAWFGLVSGLIIALPALVLDDSIWMSIITPNATNEISVEGDITVDDEKLAAVRAVISGIVIFLIIVGLYQVVISSFLIFGIIKRNGCCMLPWIISSAIGCVISILAFIIVIFSPAFVAFSSSTIVAVYTYFEKVFGTFFNICVQIYCYLTVFTFYRDLKSRREGFTTFQKA